MLWNAYFSAVLTHTYICVYLSVLMRGPIWLLCIFDCQSKTMEWLDLAVTASRAITTVLCSIAVGAQCLPQLKVLICVTGHPVLILRSALEANIVPQLSKADPVVQ